MEDDINVRELLTPRELAIVRELAAGKSNFEIALALGYTVGTVRNYVSRLLHLIGAHNRVDLAVRAIREGWIDGE